jgi:1,2-diacylglycerol-3-alpha-glucose alpha-1,2-galactosyltransferase
MTILEAANTGTPMLLRDLELYKPILYDKYLKGKSNDEFADIIEAVQTDRALYNKFSSASEWISDKYNEEGIYAMWRDFYKSCLFE